MRVLTTEASTSDVVKQANEIIDKLRTELVRKEEAVRQLNNRIRKLEQQLQKDGAKLSEGNA